MMLKLNKSNIDTKLTRSETMVPDEYDLQLTPAGVAMCRLKSIWPGAYVRMHHPWKKATGLITASNPIY